MRFDEKAGVLRWIAWFSEVGSLERSLVGDEGGREAEVVEYKEAVRGLGMGIEGGEKRFWPEVIRLDNSMRGGIQDTRAELWSF